MFSKIIPSQSRTILLFVVLGWLCYGWILNSSFKLLDDYACIVENPAIHSLRQWPDLFKDSFFGGDGAYYRPLVSLSFALEYGAVKLNPWLYNLDNILLHIATALLVFSLLNRLLQDRTTAFWAALLFLIHPVSWEQVTNIPGRSILLCAFFCVLSVRFLLNSFHSPRRMFHYAVSLAAFAAALLSKESAMTLPGVIAILMMTMIQADLRRKIMMAVPYGVILLGYLAIRSHLGITKVIQGVDPQNVVLAVATFLKSLAIHAQTLLLPNGLIYDRSLEVFKSLDDPGCVLTLILAAGSFAALVIFRRRISRPDWFWLAWVALSLLPVSQLVPIYVSDGRISIADHFLYLPSIGIFVLLVEGFRRISRASFFQSLVSVSLQKFFLAVAVVFLVFMTAMQAWVSTNQFAMFEEALEDNPGNQRVRTALASAYGYVGEAKEAEYHFREVLKSSPMDVKARIGLGKALCDQNQCLRALEEYQKVVHPSPRDAELLRDNMDKTYGILVRDYETLARRNPENPDVHRVLAMLYINTGRPGEAQEHMDRYHQLIHSRDDQRSLP